MGENKECLVADGLNASLGHGFGFHHAVNGSHMIFVAPSHFCSHGLRAKDRDFDSVVAMGHGKPFSQANSRVFGHSVRGGADLI